MRRTEASFLPVRVITNADKRPRPELTAPTSRAAGAIEIDLPSGVRLRLGHGVDLKLLRGLLSALDRN